MVSRLKKLQRRRRPAGRRPAPAPKVQLPAPLPSEQVKESRMRLDTNDRRLLIAGLLQLLPPKLRETPRAWRELDYEESQPLWPIRQLLERLRDARRGHPSTWF